jgi:hypothetical protein
MKPSTIRPLSGIVFDAKCKKLAKHSATVTFSGRKCFEDSRIMPCSCAVNAFCIDAVFLKPVEGAKLM